MSSITKHKSYKKLLKEWHPTKNVGLELSDVSDRNKKMWWKCDVVDDHEWETPINIRIYGSNCPCCAGKKVVKSNCLATTHPEIAKEWHPTKNGELTPRNVLAGSNKKAWWKCDVADDHEWEASINSRVSVGNGCSCCRGFKIVKSNCLATTHPEIAKEWHSTKNGELTPRDVLAGSRKKAWWKCDVADDHEWEAVIDSRKFGKNCPCCAGKMLVKSNCLATTHPEIAKEWHSTKNGELTPRDIISGRNEKAWWKCDVADDHEWEASSNSRVYGSGCPCCNGHKVVKSNCFATIHPEIAKEWHPTKNGELTPIDVRSMSNKKVWWRCSVADDHEWEAPLSRRASGHGCPKCLISKGQLEVERVLKSHNINYETEKTFDGCKFKILLRFDFYIPGLNLLIEYDGQQHFDPIKYFGGEKALKITQKRDKIKNKFAKENNISLLRIPYYSFNEIDEIICENIK